MKEQLPLTLQFPESLQFTNFIPEANEQVVSCLQSFTQSNALSVFLFGDEGLGKSHLAQATFHLLEQNDLSLAYINMSEPGIEPMMLEGLDHFDCLIMDGLESVIVNERWQEAIFHCFNQFINKGANILCTARTSPQQWQDVIPDLTSRFLSGMVFKLSDLSDEAKLSALQIRAYEFGLELTAEVANYWLTHGSRDNHQLFQQLRQLDRASMSQKRKLTIPFLKEILSF